MSPIWDGEKAFEFLCYGHLNMSQDLGFELEQATPVLTIVMENQLTTEEELDKLIAAHEFDYSGFDGEIRHLRQLKQLESWHLFGADVLVRLRSFRESLAQNVC